MPPLSDQGHRPPEHEGKGLNSQKAKKTPTHQCSAEGSGPRRVAGVRVPSAGRRQTHRGDPQGQEPPQDGYHRHVR